MATYKTYLDYINDHADFAIRALDVGGGDSLLIQTRPNDKTNNKNYLVDTGGNSEKTKTLLWNALQNYEVEKLDAIIITHPHVDHDGNLPFLLEKEAEIKANKESVEAAGKTYTGPKFSIEKVYTNGVYISTASSRQNQYMTALGSRYDSINTEYNKILGLDDGIVWTTLWPSKSFIDSIQPRVDAHITKYGSISESASEDNNGDNSEYLESNGKTFSINNTSIVGKLTYGSNFSMLFTGDTGPVVWNSYIDQTKLQCTIYKAAHHSQTSANVGTVVKNKVKPQAVIITGGDHQNPYPYPSPAKWNTYVPRIATIQRFSNCNVSMSRIWCTRHSGDIHIAFFGDEYTVYPSHPDYIWPKLWTDLMNKSIDLTEPDRGIKYVCNGITMETVTAS